MLQSNHEYLEELKKIEVSDATYKPTLSPLVFEKAQGSLVWDVDGKEYIDFCAGFGVMALGHNHDVSKKVFARYSSSTANPIVHGMGDVYPSRAKIDFCKYLLELLPKHYVRIALSIGGGQAVEYALKTAFLKTKRSGVIAFNGSYHGLDFGVLPLVQRKDFRNPSFQKWMPNESQVLHLSYGCSRNDLEKAISTLQQLNHGCAAIIVEPIQGRAGCKIPPPGWLKMLRELTSEKNILLIYDEIFVGMGRCGLWSFSQEAHRADISCFAKAIGGGLALSACVGTADCMSSWPESTGEAIHTGTFFGHPLSCDLGYDTLRFMKEQKILDGVEAKGVFLRQLLSDNFAQKPFVKEVRGKGLMNVIEYNQDGFGARMMDLLRSMGIIALASGMRGECLAFTPALTIDQKYFPILIERMQLAHQQM